jgi:hypothetical protein
MHTPRVPPLTDVEQTTSSPPRRPASSDSPPQQSLLTRQRSPSTWQPCACWQTATPVGPYGAQSALQQPPAHPTSAGLQSVPSTPVQLTPPEEGGGPHVPGFVADTGFVFGDWQVPVQQSVPV